MRLSRKRKNEVVLEGYVDLSNSADDDFNRGKSLNDDDLDELKVCLDLRFGGFSFVARSLRSATLCLLSSFVNFGHWVILDDDEGEVGLSTGRFGAGDTLPEIRPLPFRFFPESAPL
ncbi:hypothetical protein LINGRAHAP2_LOCUS1667 [Linum grandiflorum]